MNGDPIVILLDSYNSEAAAVTAMHRQAAVIRKRRQTKRFGVFVDKHRYFRDTWCVYLSDRGNA